MSKPGAQRDREIQRQLKESDGKGAASPFVQNEIHVFSKWRGGEGGEGQEEEEEDKEMNLRLLRCERAVRARKNEMPCLAVPCVFLFRYLFFGSKWDYNDLGLGGMGRW
jgi:hypothetical protein